MSFTTKKIQQKNPPATLVLKYIFNFSYFVTNIILSHIYSIHSIYLLLLLLLLYLFIYYYFFGRLSACAPTKSTRTFPKFTTKIIMLFKDNERNESHHWPPC